jgi:enoyl-CoA hydratase
VSATVLLDRPMDGLARITLNRPERRNAVDATMIAEFGAVLRELTSGREDRAVVLTGAGQAFCSGMDQRHTGYEDRIVDGDVDALLDAQREIANLVLALRALPQPVVAAVNGSSVGAGLAFALACDIRLAGASATFGVGAIRIGLSGADMGMSWHLPRIVGLSRAAEWMLTGRRVTASEAERAGLVSAVVPDDGLEDAWRVIGEQILGHQDYAVRLTKKALWVNAGTSDLATAIELENQTQVLASTRLWQQARIAAAGPTR